MAHASLLLAGLLGASYVVFWLLNQAVLARRQTARAREWGCEEPPREPFRWPLGLDNIRDALEADRQKLFPDFFLRRAEAMGVWTWQYHLFGKRIVTTQEPDNIKALLATQFGTYDLGEQRRGLLWPLLGNGIFTQSGHAWKHSRDMMRPQFTRDQVSDLALEERHVQHMMSALDARTRADSTSSSTTSKWTDVVDLQALFFRLTLDSATEFLLGESADSQLQHIPGYPRARNSAEALHQVDFARAFDRGQAGLATRARFGPMYWLWSSREFRDCIQQCHRFMDHYVRRALSKEQRDQDVDKDMDKEDKYVFLDALAEQTQDPIELRSQLLHILLAGRDTTASMLGWLFLRLARDPARYQKLRAAVVAQFGTYDQPRDMSFATLKNCAYLQQCNNEILRLYPVVPINARHAFQDATLPVGGGPDGKAPIFIAKGTAVEYSVYALHRRKDLWGPDADDFIPERWENRKVGWEYVPFNGYVLAPLSFYFIFSYRTNAVHSQSSGDHASAWDSSLP